jgi:hypothetical protein
LSKRKGESLLLEPEPVIAENILNLIYLFACCLLVSDSQLALQVLQTVSSRVTILNKNHEVSGTLLQFTFMNSQNPFSEKPSGFWTYSSKSEQRANICERKFWQVHLLITFV